MKSPILVAVAVALVSTSALAHGDKPHGDTPHGDAPHGDAKADGHAAGAQKKAEHPQPHGGQVFILDAADHMHAEVVFAESGVRLWIYDQDMKPMTPPADAKATLVVGKEVRKLDLKLTEKLDGPDAKVDPHLAVATPLPKDGKLALVVQATVGGKLRSGRVERDVAGSAPASTPAPAPATH